MTLREGLVGRSYMIQNVLLQGHLSKRLEALGVNEDTKITILNKKRSGTLILRIRGTRLALGQKISEGIEVREVQIHEWIR